jgi:ligand-binding sensor domain-containing protein
MKRLLFSELCFTAMLVIYGINNCMAQHKYSFRHIGVENGLSQGSIYHMHKDSRGFLWLGTEDGINRFDGKNILVYLSGSSGKSTNIIGIAEDTLSDLWVGSHKGCFRYVRKYNRFEREKSLKIFDNVSVYVFADRQKNICFLSENGLYTLKNGILNLITSELIYSRSQYNNFLTQTPDGSFWLVGATSGIKRFVPQTKRVIHYFSNHPANSFGSSQTFDCISVDKSGQLWLASKNGMYKFDGQNNEIKAFNLANEFAGYVPTDIKEDNHRQLWVATEGKGIFIFDLKSEKIVQHLIHEDDVTNSLRFNEIGTIYIDDKNDIFVNTDPQGLDILSEVPSAFSFYSYGKNQENNLSDYSIRGLAEDADSTIWAGTELGGINRLNPKTSRIRHYTIKDGLPGNTVRYILRDRNNVIWVATTSGLARFQPANNRFIAIQLPVSCEVSNIIPMSADRLLLSSNKGLLILNTSTNKIVRYSQPDLIAGYGSHWDSQKNLAYIANRYRGVNVFEIKNDSPRLKAMVMEGFHVLQIFHEPGTKVLWATTDRGLVKWDLHTNTLIKHYRIADGLHHEYLYCLLPDSFGYFWLSTNRGITRFNPKTDSFEFIKEITPREYNSRTALAARNGNLYFGSTSGLDVIKPHLLSLQDDQVGIQLTELTLDREMSDDENTHISELDAIILPYDNNTFTLKFTATDLRSGGLNRFRYFLKGYDKDTIFAGNDDQLRYARLPAGPYELHLQASDLRGNWVSNVRKLKIKILPPFWQTWWFILLSIILLAAVIIVAIKAYLQTRLTAQRLESEKRISLEKERSRIARDMNDALGSELFGLKLIGQAALYQNNKESTETNLQKIVTISKGISERISEIIWLTDSSQDNAESLWTYIQKNALIYLKPSGISYHFDSLPEDHVFQISGERRHEILNLHKLLFVELTKNAAPQTELFFKILAENLMISINNTTLCHIEQAFFNNLSKLGGKRVSSGNLREVIEIPLPD